MFGNLRSYFNICTLYVILWGLYGFHWYDVSKGSVLDSLSIVFIGINFIISFWCILKMKGWALPSFFKYVKILLVTFTIYGIFDILFGESYTVAGEEVNKMSYFISIYRSFLPIYAFYYFAQRGLLNQKTVKGYFIIMLLFYVIYDVLFSQYMLSFGGYTDGFTNNLGYIFLSLIPFAYVFEKKTLYQYGVVIIAMLLIFISMKRGALIIGLIISGWFFLNEYQEASSLKKFFIVAITFMVVGIGVRYMLNYVSGNEFAQARLEQTLDGDSSGRDKMYSELFKTYENDYSIIEMVVGAGANAPAKILGKEAHNDWLEILMCQGLIGVFIYFLYWKSFYAYWRRSRYNSTVYFIFGSFVITQFLRSLISMSYAAVPTAAVLLLGYSIANSQVNK